MKKELLTAIALAMCLRAYSQEVPPGVIVSSGGSGQSDQAQLSWTVGEPFVGTLSSGSGSLTQGFFYQASSLLTAVHSPEPVQGISVFPNPVTDRLTIEVPNRYASYHLRMLDAVGRERIFQTLAGGAEKTVDVSTFPSGSYYLQMRDTANKTVKTFKIYILR